VDRGQPPRRARELAADLDLRLDRRATSQRLGQARRNVRSIADKPRRPESNVWIVMIKCHQGGRLIQSADQVERPERLEGELAGDGRILKPKPQRRSARGVLAIADEAKRRLSGPLVGIGQTVDEACRVQSREVFGLALSMAPLRTQAIDPPAGR